ncbi:MAG: hypothetical protein M0Z41_16795 [Peptococcaceae bacterium]|nr:hypothetical protein [Peptococcaceae bacterium]
MDAATTEKDIAAGLSPLEKANAAKILAYEKSMGSQPGEPPVVFTLDRNLYRVAADGSQAVQLTATGNYTVADYLRGKGKSSASEPLQTPKADEGYPGGDVVSIDVRTGRSTLLLPASASEVLSDGSIPGFDLALGSPDGKNPVAGEPNPYVPGDKLYVAAADGSHLVRLSTRLAGGVSVNPDGSGLAFENQRSDVGPVTIYDLPWDGSPVPLLPLTDQGLWAGGYAWRPDGQGIAFAGSTDNLQGPAQSANNGIYLVTTGGQVTPLWNLPPVRVSALHWLGTDRLSFVTVLPAGGPSAGGLATVYTYDIRAGRLATVMSFPAQDLWTKLVAWNPDNTAFVFRRDGSLWLRDLSTGQEKQLPGTEGAESSAW